MTISSAAMMARGMVFCGSLTSSPAVDTASRPMKEKKIVPPRRDRRDAEWREVREVVGVEGGERDDDEQSQHAELDDAP